MAYPTCRVVRRSMALRRPLVFCVTCGVTCRCRRLATQSLVSYPLSAAKVRGWKPRSRAASISLGAMSRSAVPVARVSWKSTTSPLRFSISAWPMNQMSFFTFALLGQERVGISGALMRRIRAALAVEVDRRIARIVRRRIRRRLVLGAEALQAGRGFDQRAVDREVLVAQQPQTSRLTDHLIEEPLGNLVPEQPPAVLGERSRVEAGLQQAHIQEPAVQELVVELFTEGPLTAHRVQADEQRRLEQPLRWDRWSATRGVHLVKDRRQLTQGSISKLLDDPQRVVPWDPLLQVHERQHRCLRITSPAHSDHLRRRWLYRIRITHPTGRANLGRSGRISAAC